MLVAGGRYWSVGVDVRGAGVPFAGAVVAVGAPRLAFGGEPVGWQGTQCRLGEQARDRGLGLGEAVRCVVEVGLKSGE